MSMQPQPKHSPSADLHPSSGGRRSFLLGSAGLIALPVQRAALLALPVSLAGCLEGGGSQTVNTHGTQAPEIALTGQATHGTISLPAGAKVTVTTVASLFSQTPPATDGSFQVVTVAEAPMVVSAFNASNSVLLMGFAQNGSVTLSANSTAVVLAYYALGVGAYVSEVQLAYLTIIQSAPSLSALESAVAAALVASGEGWLDPGNATLSSTIAAVQQALCPAALAAASGYAPVTAAGRKTMVEQEIRDHDRPPAQFAAIVDKSGMVSGLTMQITGTGTLTIENSYRRRSNVFVNEVSYTLPGSATQIPSPAAIGTQPLLIPPTDGVGNFVENLGTALGAASSGQVPSFYTPNFSDPISVPLAPSNASSTTYTVTAVGLGVGTGDLGRLTDAQTTAWINVCAQSLVCDLIGPLVANLLIPGMAGEVQDAFPVFASTTNYLADCINAVVTADKVKTDLAAGDMKSAFFDGINAITESNTIPTLVQGILAFCKNFQLSSLPIGPGGTATGTPLAVTLVGDVMAYFTKINAALTAVDTVVQGLQIIQCNSADVFTITLTPAQILLVPSTMQFVTTTSPATTYTVSINDPTVPASQKLTYNWSCSCNFGTIATGDQASSEATLGTPASFDSPLPNCLYAPASAQALGGDTDVLTAKVFLGAGLSSTLPGLGQKQAVITYLAPITPNNTQIAPGAQQLLTAGMSGRLNNPQPFKFTWTCTGGNGSFPDGATQTTSTPTITYTSKATASGTDTINLVVLDANGVLVTKGMTTIVTEPQYVATITPANQTLDPGDTQSFSVSVAAKSGSTLPTGLTYQWSVSGSGTLTPPTNAVTVSYTAPSSSTTDTLTVNVLDAGGAVIATQSTTITVAPDLSAWANSWAETVNGYVGILSFYPAPYDTLPPSLPLSGFNPGGPGTNLLLLFTAQPFDGVGYTYLIADATTATDPAQQTTYTLSDGNVIAQNLFGVAGDQTFTPYPAGPNLTP